VQRPTRWLAGFAAATANPGQEATVEVTVPARSLAHWDGASRAWAVEPGSSSSPWARAHHLAPEPA
jgi:beta-glucosidase